MIVLASFCESAANTFFHMTVNEMSVCLSDLVSIDNGPMLWTGDKLQIEDMISL